MRVIRVAHSNQKTRLVVPVDGSLVGISVFSEDATGQDNGVQASLIHNKRMVMRNIPFNLMNPTYAKMPFPLRIPVNRGDVLTMDLNGTPQSGTKFFTVFFTQSMVQHPMYAEGLKFVDSGNKWQEAVVEPPPGMRFYSLMGFTWYNGQISVLALKTEILINQNVIASGYLPEISPQLPDMVEYTGDTKNLMVRVYNPPRTGGTPALYYAALFESSLAAKHA